APRAEDVDVLRADAVPRRHDRAGISELAHLDIGTAVTQELDTFRTGARMTRAIHHQIGAKTANDVPHALDTFVRKLELFDVHSRLGAEFARELQPRLLGRANGDYPARPHFLGGRHRQNSDRAGALNNDSVAPGETTGPHRAIEGANA